METLTIIYLFYTFITLYFLFLFSLTFMQNRKEISSYPKPKKIYSLSIIIPCFNAEKDIGNTITNLLKSDYKGLKKIIVVDDCSTDNSYKIMKEYAKKYPLVMAVQTPKNTGNAAGAKNYGAKFAKTELIGFTDDDSIPQPDAISKMVGFFNDPKVGAVTSRVLVYNREKFISKLQAIEYKLIAFTRKMLGFLDAIYVTNGPLSIYTKKAFDDVNGFDEKNLTEDIEITWHFVKKGYKVHMSIPAKVYTLVPDNFKAWYKQRIRWNVGGLQTTSKYKKTLLKCGMLGKFILPFFTISWVLGLFGLSILIYRLFNSMAMRYLSTKYSIEAQTAIITLNDFNFSPSILFFFGIVILIMSITYNAIALIYSKEKDFKRNGLFNIFAYMFFYLLAYPLILITSLYKFLRGYNTW